MSSLVRRSLVLSALNCSAALFVIGILAAIVSAQSVAGTRAGPNVLEQTFDFPPPIQWNRGDMEFSLTAIAFGPADSWEMLATGRKVQEPDQPHFFPDRPYALALRFRAKRFRGGDNESTSSGLQRITNVQGDREYPWALTPSGFVQFANMPGIWDVHFEKNDSAEFRDFFPVSPRDDEFLFQMGLPETDPAVSFKVLVKDGKLSVVNVSPVKGGAFTREFRGSIGARSKLTMQLTADGSQLSGTEQYARIGQTLWVRGALDSLGNFRLTEYYPQEQPTGILNGRFSRNYLEMSGYFAKPDGSRLLPFELHEVSTIDNQDRVGAVPVPCPTPDAPAGWKVYVNKKYGFCFSYPPNYEPVAEPWLEKDIYSAESSNLVRQEVKERRFAKFQNQRMPDLGIDLLVGTEPFNLESFVKQAPTGEENPPSPRDIRGRTFYYYGPGGGGVCYADQFFYNLRSKPLFIYFDGCVDDKTPPQETKKIEPQMLATFRTF